MISLMNCSSKSAFVSTLIALSIAEKIKVLCQSVWKMCESNHYLSKIFLNRIFKETRQQTTSTRKYLWVLVIYILIIVFVMVYYGAMASGLANITQEYQWILMLIVPILREAAIWIMFKVCSKAADAILPNKLTICHYFDTQYIVFISIMLSSTATPESTYCLIAVDFLTNLYHGWKIIKNSQAGKDGK